MRKNVPHSYRAVGKQFRTRWVTFLGGDGVLDYYEIGNWFLFHAETMFLSATDYLWQVCIGNSTVLTRSAAGYNWLVEWLHGCFAPTAPLTVQVRRYLEAHFSENLSLICMSHEKLFFSSCNGNISKSSFFLDAVFFVF